MNPLFIKVHSHFRGQEEYTVNVANINWMLSKDTFCNSDEEEFDSSQPFTQIYFNQSSVDNDERLEVIETTDEIMELIEEARREAEVVVRLHQP